MRFCLKIANWVISSGHLLKTMAEIKKRAHVLTLVNQTTLKQFVSAEGHFDCKVLFKMRIKSCNFDFIL